MHLIVATLSVIGVALVGFVGHVIAHDFCERTPALARWLLTVAVKSLAPSLRERYAEEWAAHLADCEGVIAKLRHALGCVWCAQQLLRHELRSVRLRVDFDLPAIGIVTVGTNLYEASVLIWLHNVFGRTKPTNYVYVGALILLFFRRVYVDAHAKYGVTGTDFMLFLNQSKRADFVPTGIHLTLGNDTIDLLGLLRACSNSVTEMLKKITKALRSNAKSPTAETITKAKTGTAH